MKKYLLISSSILLLPPLIIYGWLALTIGHHQYARMDFFSYWLYTPERLKQTPPISDSVSYEYNFDPDNQRTLVTVRWSLIRDIAAKKKALQDFIDESDGFKKYNCVWMYHDEKDYTNNYQRYCIYQKGETLELEFFNTET